MKCVFLLALAGITLAMPAMAQDEYRPSANIYGNGEYQGAENVRAAKSFTSLADAIRRLPDMPKAEQLLSEHAKYIADSTIYAPYNLAIEQNMFNSNGIYELDARLNQARMNQADRGKQAMQQYDRNVSAGLMPSQQEMMQIIMSSGIDMEKATPDQMMDVMANAIAPKWGVSKQEFIKIMNMAQNSPKQTEGYLKQNHPDLYKRLYAANEGGQARNEEVDPREDRFGQINGELMDLQSELSKAMGDYKNENERVLRALHAAQSGDESYDFEVANLAGDKMSQLAAQLHKEWLNSSEAKQIDAIETALWERVAQWESGIPLNEYGFADVPYPGWWEAERKKENALIDQWNRRAVVRWLEPATAYQQQLKAIFEKIVALDEENEQLNKSGSPDHVIYLMNKREVLVLFGQLNVLMDPYHDAFLFPCIEHFEESGTAHIGKG